MAPPFLSITLKTQGRETGKYTCNVFGSLDVSYTNLPQSFFRTQGLVDEDSIVRGIEPVTQPQGCNSICFVHSVCLPVYNYKPGFGLPLVWRAM